MTRPSSEYQSPTAGLYIHIPFCIHKCAYCDFYSVTDLSLVQPFIRALRREMEMIRNASFRFDTIYLGGGTPSVFQPREIEKIIESAHRSFRLLPDPEITMEINPGTIDMEQLTGYKRAGVNRINIGIQSFHNRYLKFLGRVHSSKEAQAAIKMSQKAGFKNIGLDLIYGIPGQTQASWHLDLGRAVSHSPDHLSCYMLTYESGMPLERQLRSGRFSPLSEQLAGDLMETTRLFLSDKGYIQYEISNFAKSDAKRSRHNSKYWSFVPYVGLGPSSHSFIPPQRYWNHTSVNRYIKDIESGRLPIAGKEVPNREQQMTETIYLGLRTSEGINIKDFEKKFKIAFIDFFCETINDLKKERMIRVSKNYCALTPKGLRFLDSVAGRFISH